jgi:hypothetical protein
MGSEQAKKMRITAQVMLCAAFVGAVAAGCGAFALFIFLFLHD